MAEGVRVDRLEVLKEFKAVLWKFQEMAIGALGDAESEMRRMVLWLETEQDSYWTLQIRKRQEAVQAAKDAVRSKKLFRDSSGRAASSVEEEKALQLAMRRLAEAQHKLENVRKWARALQKEVELYKGSVVRLATSVHSDLPAAAAYLDTLAAQLDAYVALQAAPVADLGGAAEADCRAATGVGGAAAADDGAGKPAEISENLLPPGSAGVGLTGAAAAGAAVPTGDQRAAAIPVAKLALAVAQITAEQIAGMMAGVGAAVGEITGETPPDDGSGLVAAARITVLATASDATRVVLHHAQPIGEHDSGWCIMPVAEAASPRDASATNGDDPPRPPRDGAAAGEWYSVRLGDLLIGRTQWRTLLRLPVGFSAIIGPKGLELVTWGNGRENWRPT